jgi:hypothetical protein
MRCPKRASRGHASDDQRVEGGLDENELDENELDENEKDENEKEGDQRCATSITTNSTPSVLPW